MYLLPPPPRFGSALDGRLPHIDVIRGLTILWVTVLHFYVDTRGVPGPDVASASAAWSALLAARPLEAAAVAVRSLVGLPGFRLDLLLFVTALVAMLGRQVPARCWSPPPGWASA